MPAPLVAVAVSAAKKKAISKGIEWAMKGIPIVLSLVMATFGLMFFGIAGAEEAKNAACQIGFTQFSRPVIAFPRNLARRLLALVHHGAMQARPAAHGR